MDEIWKVVERAILVATAAAKRSAADRAKALRYLREMAEVLRLGARDHAALMKVDECIELLSTGDSPEAGQSKEIGRVKGH